jgi:hypothetical protein
MLVRAIRIPIDEVHLWWKWPENEPIEVSSNNRMETTQDGERNAEVFVNRELLTEPNYAHVSAPLDEQRFTKNIVRTPVLDKAFRNVKDIVRINLSVVSRNRVASLCVATDASSTGLGYILAQVKPEYLGLAYEDVRQEPWK